MNSDPSGKETTDSDDESLRKLVQQLDCQVPMENAWVKLVIYGGGPDETMMEGNLNGLRRFGIEFLKMTIDVESGAPSSDSIRHLLHDDSDIFIDWVERKELVAIAPNPNLSEAFWWDRLFMLGCGLVATFFLFVFATGLLTIFGWIG
ncbi:MAG: hypothetical protein AAGA30_13110 [Planctomycetota bacterium]